MPLQATSGAASYDAFGGGVPVVPKYIEEYFSTFLYSGNAGTKTVTNGIDLSTKGGMVWIKSRSGAFPHSILDTVRGFNYSGTQTKRLDPSTTDSQADAAGNATQASPLTDGFSVTTSGGGAINFYNASGSTYTSWSFAKAPKFFDVVTWSGNSVSGRAISHNLGSTPGCIIVKCTSTSGDDWIVYHRSLGSSSAIFLNLTSASGSYAYWDGTAPTSTTFTLSSNGSVNGTGNTYVAYLFAHDAGGFGLTGTDNVISCGSFTCDGSGNADVTLGYEPQWLLVKPYDASGYPWYMGDIMRGMPLTGDTRFLRANTSGAETGDGGVATFRPTATGFQVRSFSQANIYIAIRRGPMKVPTVGTSVYMGATRTGNGAITSLTAAGFPPDLYWAKSTAAVRDHAIFDRLRGPLPLLSSNNTQNEIAYSDDLKSFDMTGVTTGTDGSTNAYNQNSVAYVNWYMRRAPSFFDEVCYTGTGSNLTLNHNLGVAPEVIIIKKRVAIGASTSWYCGWNMQNVNGSSQPIYTELFLEDVNSGIERIYSNWFASAPTATTFALAGGGNVNSSGAATVAYLFATCAGVSKVLSYTGNGSSQTINCGFTSGARFVLIKRTDSTGDWYVWDSARGIVSGNDPHLSLNTTAAEVTSDDTIDTDSTGFVVNQVSATNVNVSSATYIGLAIA